MDPQTPPTEAPPVGNVRVKSLLLVNTGDGKGKSTAAFGTVMRAVARGWKVAVIQFLKSGDWKVGEEKIARQIGADWWAMGDGFTWDSEDMEESQAIAVAAWSRARELISSGDYDLVVRALVIASILVVTTSARGERPLCRQGAKYHGRALDLDVKDADVHDVMRLLADVGNINIVVADNVRAKVTLRLQKVAWDLVACTIASVHKLDLTIHDNVVLVKSRGK